MKASRHHSSRIPTATNIALTETVDGATVLSVSHSAVTNTATIDAYCREMVRTDASMDPMDVTIRQTAYELYSAKYKGKLKCGTKTIVK